MRRVVVGCFMLSCLACGGGAPRPLATPDFTVDCATLSDVGEDAFNAGYLSKMIRVTGVVKNEAFGGEFSLEGSGSSCYLQTASGAKGSGALNKGDTTTWQCDGKKWNLGPVLEYCRPVP